MRLRLILAASLTDFGLIFTGHKTPIAVASPTATLAGLVLLALSLAFLMPIGFLAFR